MELSFQNKSDYLLITTTGSWTTNEMPCQVEMAKNESEARGYTRLCLDTRNLDLPENEMTRFITGENIAKLLPPPFKIAVLALPESINRFAENTAVNRGAVMTVFSDQETALKWLLEATDR